MNPFMGWSNRRLLANVIGLGDAGARAVQYIANEVLRNVECVVINTHAPDEATSAPLLELIIGPAVARDRGTGGDPEVGRLAAEESRSEIEQVLTQWPYVFSGRFEIEHVSASPSRVFIVSGMGGGTGTGAAPIIAHIARKLGARISVIVSQPFIFEGSRRLQIAEGGIHALQRYDDVAVVNYNNLLNFSADLRTSKSAVYLFTLGARALAWQVLARLSATETD